MTRRQRASACAIAIIPVSAACGFLLQCPTFIVIGWTIEIATGAGYVVWIIAAPTR